MSSISKILFRRGTNFDRLCAQDVGVTLSVGEPGYTVDTKRLYVGDGSIVGGVPAGMRNLGAVNQLFGTFAGTRYSPQAYYILTLSGVEVGDVVYDRETRVLYSLTGRSSIPPLTSDFVKYDFTVQINPDQLEFNTLGQIQIKPQSILPGLVSSSIAGGSLSKPTVNGPIIIRDKGVENRHLEDMPAFTVKLNNSIVAGTPVDLVVGPKQFIGRSSNSAVTALNFESILAESNIQTANGIIVNKPTQTTSIFSLCSNVFQVNNSKANILQPTTINSTLSVLSQSVFSNYLAVSGITNVANTFFAQEINTRGGGRINAGTGTLSGGIVFCNELLLQGSAGISTNGGPINTGGGAINTQGGGIDTGNGTINTGTGDVFCKELFATGDVTAFNTSDARLKTDLTLLDNTLEKIDDIAGYSFVWSKESDNEGKHDIGLIAQEVNNILPTAVQLKSNGYYGVEYIKLIPFLVNCIKELKSEINSLKNEIQQIGK
jgi:hypothetical protein